MFGNFSSDIVTLSVYWTSLEQAPSIEVVDFVNLLTTDRIIGISY